jgi:hypothetical protein
MRVYPLVQSLPSIQAVNVFSEERYTLVYKFESIVQRVNGNGKETARYESKEVCHKIELIDH